MLTAVPTQGDGALFPHKRKRDSVAGQPAPWRLGPKGVRKLCFARGSTCCGARFARTAEEGALGPYPRPGRLWNGAQEVVVWSQQVAVWAQEGVVWGPKELWYGAEKAPYQNLLTMVDEC